MHTIRFLLLTTKEDSRILEEAVPYVVAYPQPDR